MANDSIKDTFVKNIEKARANAVSEDTSSEVPAEAKEQKSEDKSSDTTAESKEKTDKKNTFQARYNAKHAEAMQYKEKADKLESQIELLQKQYQEIQKPKPQEPTEEELVLETVDDLKKALKGVVTQKDLERVVSEIVDKRLTVAKESVEKQTKEQHQAKLAGEFDKLMYEFYKDKQDPESGFDDDVKTEATQIYELFISKPEFYLAKAKDKGIGYLKKFISGEFDAEKKAEQLKTIVEKANAVRTNTDSASNVSEADRVDIPRNWKGIFSNAAKIIKKGA